LDFNGHLFLRPAESEEEKKFSQKLLILAFEAIVHHPYKHVLLHYFSIFSSL